MLLFLLACDPTLAQRPEADPTAQQRANVVDIAPPATFSPSCSPRPGHCDQLPVDPARCISDAGLFRVVQAQGVPVDAKLDYEALASLRLEPGVWHSRFPHSRGGCDELVVTFEATEGEAGATTGLAQADAAHAAPSQSRVNQAWGDQPAWAHGAEQRSDVAAGVAP